MRKKKKKAKKKIEPKKGKNELEQIEAFAQFQFTQKEVAVLMGRSELNGTHATAYLRGRLKAEAEVRKSILHHAKAGSSPAQKSYLDLIAKREKAEGGKGGKGMDFMDPDMVKL